MSTANIDRHVAVVLSDGTLVDATHPLPTTGAGGGGGAVTVADGADSAEGFTTDTAVQGDNPGTISAKLRGLNKSVAAGVPITAAALPLPAGAAQDRTTAAAPSAVELSDGGAFYASTKTGQLPTALVGARLDVNVGKVPATISTANSSTTALLSAGVFTGTSEDVSAYALIDVSVLADQASAGGGLSLQFSSNGTNWDITQNLTIAANAGMAFTICPCAQFFRIVYTNGGTGQGVFRLQTVYHQVASVPTTASFQDVNATTSPTTVSQRVAADMMIQDAGGNATNRVRSAKDLIPGVGGATLLGQASGVYQTSDTKFYPWVGTSTGGGFVQGAAAVGSPPGANPVSVAGWDGTNKQHLLTDSSGRQVMTGAAAAGAVPAGNPLLLGAVDPVGGTTLNALQVVSAAAPQLRVSVYSSNTQIGAFTTSTDGLAAGAALAVVAEAHVKNGVTWDGIRNNIDVTLLSSAARTTLQSGTITTYNLGAIKFILDMTVATAGPSVTLTINEVDPASGKSILLLSGAAVTGVSTNEYTVDPMVPAVANVSAQKRLTRQINWTVTANNANTATYSLGSMQLPA